LVKFILKIDINLFAVFFIIGSHLPDLTVITPVFHPKSEKPVFFVANRGHHADIGGLTPGSMPPNSTKLWEEGAFFKSTKIVEQNVFKEEGL
jgi:5-oxoprolinase (ATP-hydrolysing)